MRIKLGELRSLVLTEIAAQATAQKQRPKRGGAYVDSDDLTSLVDSCCEKLATMEPNDKDEFKRFLLDELHKLGYETSSLTTKNSGDERAVPIIHHIAGDIFTTAMEMNSSLSDGEYNSLDKQFTDDTGYKRLTLALRTDMGIVTLLRNMLAFISWGDFHAGVEDEEFKDDDGDFYRLVSELPRATVEMCERLVHFAEQFWPALRRFSFEKSPRTLRKAGRSLPWSSGATEAIQRFMAEFHMQTVEESARVLDEVATMVRLMKKQHMSPGSDRKRRLPSNLVNVAEMILGTATGGARFMR